MGEEDEKNLSYLNMEKRQLIPSEILDKWAFIVHMIETEDGMRLACYHVILLPLSLLTILYHRLRILSISLK